MVRNKEALHTVDLPLPVAPMTLEGALIHQPEDTERYVRNPDFSAWIRHYCSSVIIGCQSMQEEVQLYTETGNTLCRHFGS